MMKGTVGEATGVVHDLRENFGIFCSVVVYPVIPKGMILLRLIPTAVHTLADVEETIKSMGYIGRVGMRSTDTEILNVMIDKVNVNQDC